MALFESVKAGSQITAQTYKSLPEIVQALQGASTRAQAHRRSPLFNKQAGCGWTPKIVASAPSITQ
jgi:hypothetical protein